MDTWEYKPQLQQDDGKVGPGGGSLLGSKFKFSQHGQSGAWVSELYPHTAKHVDKFCFIRGLHTDTPAHPGGGHPVAHRAAALAQLTRPSLGRLAALRSRNREPRLYPRFTSRSIRHRTSAGPSITASAFLPAHFQRDENHRSGLHPKSPKSNRPQGYNASNSTLSSR